MNQQMSESGGFIGIPATVLTWLNYMSIMKLTPILQFFVTLLSFVWLVIQIGGWVAKKLKSK